MDLMVFHAGTKALDGKLVTNGGRVCCVTALAPSLQEAVVNAREAMKGITFEGNISAVISGMSFRRTCLMKGMDI
jgi:phosphoribosylamine-glycine ligase